MLISDRRQFIFVHVRKAGGTSLRSRLEPFANQSERTRLTRLGARLGLIRDYRKLPFHPHAPLVVAQRAMPADLYDQYFKFAVVRNPWARLLSEFDYIREFTIHPRYPAISQMSLDEFVDYQIARPKAYQLPMLVDAGGSFGIDDVLKLENLDADYQRVAARLDLDASPLPRLNQQEPSRDYRSRFSDYAAERIGTAFRDEIARFNYSYD